MLVDQDKWQQICEWLQPTLDRGGNTHSMDDIKAGIETGEFQLWAGERAAAVTRVASHPQKKIASVFLAGGDLAELVDMKPHFEKWAKGLGCDCLEIFGRSGWERVHRDFEKQGIILRKEI